MPSIYPPYVIERSQRGERSYDIFSRLLYGALLKHLRCECARLTEYSARCAAFHSAEALQILIENAVCDGCGFLWNLIAESKTLYDFALDGESVSSGSRHGDNVAPMLLGGVVMATATRMIALPVPAALHAVVVHPDQVLETRLQ